MWLFETISRTGFFLSLKLNFSSNDNAALEENHPQDNQIKSVFFAFKKEMLNLCF